MNLILLTTLVCFFLLLFILTPYICLDVISEESIKKASVEVEEIVQEDGLNCLINNAGINVMANFETVTAEKMLKNFHTNCVGPLMITKVISLSENKVNLHKPS